MGKYRVTETERGPAGAFVMQAASEDELRAMLLRKNITPIKIECIDPTPEPGRGFDPKLFEGMTPEQRVMMAQAMAAAGAAKPAKQRGAGELAVLIVKIILLIFWFLVLAGMVIGGLGAADTSAGVAMLLLGIALGVVTAILLARAKAK